MLKILVSPKLLSQTQGKKKIILVVLSDTANHIYSWLEWLLFVLELHREIKILYNQFSFHMKIVVLSLSGEEKLFTNKSAGCWLTK